MFRLSVLAALLLLPGLWSARAQATREELAAHPERAAGIYHSYEYRPSAATPAPEGYEPFYISHYGRHGSRWHTSESMYLKPLETLRKAAEEGALTPRGRELLERVEAIAADARGREGDLSPRGVEEHRGIAERMYASFPEVFSTDSGRVCRIQSRSTVVPRCILSMAAFNERLKELDPQIRITREASKRYMDYLSHTPGYHSQREAAWAVADSMLHARVDPRRFLSEVFSDPGFVTREVEDPVRFMDRIYALAAIMQDVSYLGISLDDFFTDEERFLLWESANARRYLAYGPSRRFGDRIVPDAKPLLRNIVESAQRVIDGEEDLSATLRFGHDTNIIPLLALLGVEGASARVGDVDSIRMVWNDYRVSPMGTNLQLIFYRNAQGDVLVRVLHREREVRLPLGPGPYYPWEEFRRYCEALYE